MEKTGNRNLLDEFAGAQLAMSTRPLMRNLGTFSSGVLVDQVSSCGVVNCYVYTDGSHTLYEVNKGKELLSAFQIGFFSENSKSSNAEENPNR